MCTKLSQCFNIKTLKYLMNNAPKWLQTLQKRLETFQEWFKTLQIFTAFTARFF